MNPQPVADLPISIDVHGVRIIGFIRALYPNGLSIEMISPFQATGSAPHIPYFALGQSEHYADRSGLTRKGRETARRILRELYLSERLRSEQGGRPERR